MAATGDIPKQYLHIARTKPELALQGPYPAGTCGEGFVVHLRRQFDDYARVIAQANIKA